MIYTRATGGIFDDAGGITFALTTPGTKRDGISLDMDAFQLDNFRRNPTMLWQHGMDPNRGSVPIGRWEGLRHTDGGISGVAVFDTEDAFAMSIKSKFERRFLNAVSIGWLPVRDADGAVTYDLLEASAVAVPADPSALAEGRSVVLTSEEYRAVLDPFTRGSKLASRLSSIIDSKVTDSRPRSDIIAAIASAAGISESTVNQILNGSINCPPRERLSGFASALSVSLSSLITAAEGDGCNYERAMVSVNVEKLRAGLAGLLD